MDENCLSIDVYKRQCLDSDTYLQGKGSTVARVTDGSLFFHPLTAISGEANIGDDTNWRCV